MKTKLRLTLTALLALADVARAQSTAFTYQGRLQNAGSPANGTYDFQFAVRDAFTGGSPVGFNPLAATLAVSNGLFTVTLDPGAGVFAGADRWLEIAVRTNGGGAFASLTPRQKITATPYALFAGGASAAGLTGTLPATALSGTYGNAVAFNNTGNSFTGDGAGLTNLNALNLASGTVPAPALGNAWKTAGNTGANPTNGAFLGTADNLPLEVKVNGARVLRLEPNGTSPNVIGGYGSNFINGVGGTVAGGGLAGFPNQVTESYGFVGGGAGNLAGNTAVVVGGSENRAFYPGTIVVGGAQNQAIANFSLVGGGIRNTNLSLGGVIAGGYSNYADNAYSAVGGGLFNRATNYLTAVSGGQQNLAGGRHAAVSGGGWNTASGISSFIGGGGDTFGGPWPNTASGNWSAILGGWNGTASGYSSVVGGGGNNTASGTYSVVPGGSLNEATGANSLAAGYFAKALHDGAFVWADQSGGNFASTAANQFSVRAAGGVRLQTPSVAITGDYLTVAGAGNEQAYLGGDGLADDVQVGSQNPAVGTVTLWNSGSGGEMSLITRDAAVKGTLRAPGAGVNTPTYTFLAKKTNSFSGFDHVLLIDNPLINEDSNAFLFVQHNYNGDFRLEPKAVGVYLYSIPGGARRWGIYHEDLSPMPAGAAFNVLVVKP